MKITGLIFIILGALMLVSNLLADLDPQQRTVPPETVNRTAYYIGYNAFLIIGAILLVIGILLRKKAKRRKLKNDLLKDFLVDSKQEKGL